MLIPVVSLLLAFPSILVAQSCPAIPNERLRVQLEEYNFELLAPLTEHAFPIRIRDTLFCDGTLEMELVWGKKSELGLIHLRYHDKSQTLTSIYSAVNLGFVPELDFVDLGLHAVPAVLKIAGIGPEEEYKIQIGNIGSATTLFLPKGDDNPIVLAVVIPHWRVKLGGANIWLWVAWEWTDSQPLQVHEKLVAVGGKFSSLSEN